MGTKLRRIVDMKLTSLYLDPSFNSRDCILANVARVCGLCGLRLCWLVLRRIPPHIFITPTPHAVARVAIRLAHQAARLVAKRGGQHVEHTGKKDTVGGAEAATQMLKSNVLTASLSLQSCAHADLEVLCMCLEALQSALRSRRRHAVLGEVYNALGLKRARVQHMFPTMVDQYKLTLNRSDCTD